jgi:hypothetical protein
MTHINEPNNHDNRDDQISPDDQARIDRAVAEFAAFLDCLWCLGGYVPAGTHPILGLVYHACTNCTDQCPCCDGVGLFPADTTCPHCLLDALAAVGYTAVFCHTCAGVLTVHPANEVTP